MKNVDEILNSYVDLISIVNNYIEIRHDMFLSYFDFSNEELILISKDYGFDIRNIILSNSSWIEVLNKVNNNFNVDFDLDNFNSFLNSYGYCESYNYRKDIPLEVVFKSILRINPLVNDETYYFVKDIYNHTGEIEFKNNYLTVSGFTENYDNDNVYCTLKIKKDLLNLLLSDKIDEVKSYLKNYVILFLNTLFIEIKSKSSEISLNDLNKEKLKKEDNLNKLRHLINLYPEESKNFIKDF